MRAISWKNDVVYPAVGEPNSAIPLTPDELYSLSDALDWVDVCKDWKCDN